MLSDQYELTIMRALRDPKLGGWAGPVQLAEITDLPAWTVRSTMSSLRRRRMIARGGRGHWGEFTITEHGMTELARAEQLRCV